MTRPKFACPFCGHGVSKVTGTPKHDDDRLRAFRRYRRCEKCERSYSTVEVIDRRRPSTEKYQDVDRNLDRARAHRRD
jgi:transcriptional regulator NrdR family protein